jgi:hypothetical protein
VEPQAGNTGQNVTLSRAVLGAHGYRPDSVLLISKPHMERRAFATCRKLWPDVEVICTSEPLKFGDYMRSIGDGKLVVDMLVGDLQRIMIYPSRAMPSNKASPPKSRPRTNALSLRASTAVCCVETTASGEAEDDRGAWLSGHVGGEQVVAGAQAGVFAAAWFRGAAHPAQAIGEQFAGAHYADL